MSAIFEFRRHSIKDGFDGKCLGPAGRRLAREVGRRHLYGRAFTDFFASPLARTHETFAAFKEGAGDFNCMMEPKSAPIYVEDPLLRPLRDACSRADARGEDMNRYAIRKFRPLVIDIASRAADAFELWRTGFPRNCRVLVIGHSPEMEFLAYGLKSVVVPGLRPCQGFRIEWDDQTYRIDYLSPELDPTPLLAAIAPEFI